MGPGNHVLDGSPYPAMGRGNFEGKGASHSKGYIDTLRSYVQKRLNRSRCRLSYELSWAEGIMC